MWWHSGQSGASMALPRASPISPTTFSTKSRAVSLTRSERLALWSIASPTNHLRPSSGANHEQALLDTPAYSFDGRHSRLLPDNKDTRRRDRPISARLLPVLHRGLRLIAVHTVQGHSRTSTKKGLSVVCTRRPMRRDCDLPHILWH